jgi:D-alanyl-lipoteichoic acid acyltransferase DltB (MBOAT superfamily)
MLFNSFVFIFLFLPITLIGFFAIGARGHHRVAISWLVGASLFFYGWWNPVYLGLILLSMIFNYAIANTLEERPWKPLLVIGIASNLALLGYFKYANFFVDNLNAVTGTTIDIAPIVLPLAISFFTFQQITFLIDAFHGKTREHSFLHYCLFVTFFPQLIAGPIVHHKEMLPQFASDSLYRIRPENIAVGSTIFFIGLFKKVMLADGIAVHSTPVFAAADGGMALTFFEAWGGALAYTFQIYFDFCGYSEMALGAARMFGITLPINFFSPYRASNIIEFWRRWHITLSRFLRDYLYIPLGGNRKGPTRRHANLMITMLLGGLWHGAEWTFVLWGGLHGLYLVVNHAWHALREKIGWMNGQPPAGVGLFAGRAITFAAVVVAWVTFRAETMQGVVGMYRAMAGLNGFSLPGNLDALVIMLNRWIPDAYIVAQGFGEFGGPTDFLKLLGLLGIVWFMPNTIELMRTHHPASGTETFRLDKFSVEWTPTLRWAFLIAMMAVVAISDLTKVSEFLYFQF